MARMREGECRRTRKGQTYCKEDGLVRFVGKGSGRRRRSYRGTSGLSGRRGRKMRMGECRVTRRGQEYCRTPRGNRFVGRRY